MIKHLLGKMINEAIEKSNSLNTFSPSYWIGYKEAAREALLALNDAPLNALMVKEAIQFLSTDELSALSDLFSLERYTRSQSKKTYLTTTSA